MQMKFEKWKPAIKYKGTNYTGFYEISNFGKVKSLERKGVCKSDHPKIIKNQKDKDGYLKVHLSINGNTKYETVHSLVCNAFHKNYMNKPEVNHIDGDKLNNYSNNLEWATKSENQIHAFKTGLQVSSKGEKHGRSFLKEKDIAYIRNSKETRKSLSVKYKVSIRTIFSIRSRRLWTHVP